MWKAVYKSLLMVIMVCGALLIAGKYFSPLNNPVKRWNAFYELKENSIDILFLGSSHSYASFDPDQIDLSLGTNSFNLSANSLNFEQCYFNFKETVKYQKPKIVVIELYSLMNSYLEDSSKAWIYANFDRQYLSLNKIEATVAYRPKTDYMHCLIPAIRNHENWKNFDVIKENLAFYSSVDAHHVYRGFEAMQTEMDSNTAKQYAAKGIDDNHYRNHSISPLNEKYLSLISDLAKQENIILIYVMSPMYIELINPLYHYKYEAIAAYAKAHNIDYIDFNTMAKEIGLSNKSFENAFHSYQHTSLYGAKQITSYLCDYFNKKHRNILPDRKKEEEWIARMSSGFEYQLLHLNEIAPECRIGENLQINPELSFESIFYLKTKEPDQYKLIFKINTSYSQSFFDSTLLYIHWYPDYEKKNEFLGFDFKPAVININNERFLVRDFTMPKKEVDSIHIGLCEDRLNWNSLGKRIILRAINLK